MFITNSTYFKSLLRMGLSGQLGLFSTFVINSFWTLFLRSLRIVLNIADVWYIARELVEADFVDEVSAHGVQKVWILIDDILVIEKELVRLEQLLLLYVEHVLLDIVPHDLVVFHIIIRNGLTSKHDQVVCVHHVQAYQPNPTVHNRVKHNPYVSLHV